VPYRYDYFIHPEELTQIDRWLLERGIRPGERFAVLSLRPGNRVKEWPLPHFIELASRMGRSWELTIVFSAVEPELTQEACAAVLPPTKAVAASGLSLRETAALIARASLFIGVDTGPLYIAHALSVPVVAIVGPSCPVEQLPPEGPCVALVPPPPGCTPWLFIAASPRQATTEMLRCIRETTPEIVFPAVQRLLGAPTRAS
jgi:ADP-heptose:LPS heptosyltransferase